ncbi:phage fiber-tail adaptor protein [Acetobacter oryzoeni]|uniref:phage fiber-tail adaptor protein n=1 Tax=Acetobacter oryzoeni TaxID=2500548 RepID=UPI001ABF77BF|nr:hypothetical protein [Acetobacter oryzoeni]
MIPIAPPANLRARGLVPDVIIIAWAPKPSVDRFDFSLDLSAVLRCTGDYAASASVSVPTATGSNDDLEVLWVTIVNGLVSVFLGSGPPDTMQTVRVTVTTQQGRVICQDVQLAISAGFSGATSGAVPVLPDGTPVPPNAMRAPSGTILTLGSTITQSFDTLLLPNGTQILDAGGVPLGQNIETVASDLLLIA